MGEMTRRGWLLASGAGALVLAGGCAAGRGRGFDWRPAERDRLDSAGDALPVVTRDGAAARVLRRRARPVPEGLDLDRVAARMRRAMETAGGVGIAGPQVGLGLRVAVLVIGYKTDAPQTIFVRNPVLLERSDDCRLGYEGCLSIPGVGGLVRRNRWVRVAYQDAAGRRREVRANGPDAVLWQHELDHLDGELYVDRLQGELLPMEEVRRLREARERAAEPVSSRWPPLEGALV